MMQGRGDASGRRRVRETESGRLRSDSPECRSRNHRSQGKTRKRRKEWFCFRSRMGECWYLQSSFNFRAFPRLPWFPHLFFDFQDALRPSGEAEGRPGRSQIQSTSKVGDRRAGRLAQPQHRHGTCQIPGLSNWRLPGGCHESYADGGDSSVLLLVGPFRDNLNSNAHQDKNRMAGWRVDPVRGRDPDRSS